jgi:hypothetical protein
MNKIFAVLATIFSLLASVHAADKIRTDFRTSARSLFRLPWDRSGTSSKTTGFNQDL